ncbi:MAG: metal-sensitive transcriptional regulator [Anaerolineae bacterium]
MMATENLTDYLDPDVTANLQVRLNRLEGHVRGINRMLDRQADCQRILIQLTAARAAANQVAVKVMESHIDHCIANPVLSGDQAILARLQHALQLMFSSKATYKESDLC